MTAPYILRPELPTDVGAITQVHQLAFQSHPHSAQTEHFIVLALRRAGALSVSLVAELAGQVVGHVAFSPVQFSGGAAQWYGLGPVAVLPEYQQRGIGQALIERGLDALRAQGASGCVVLGEPGYYGRFGFQNWPDCVFEGVPPAYFQSLAFGAAPAATGMVAYHPAFNATA